MIGVGQLATKHGKGEEGEKGQCAVHLAAEHARFASKEARNGGPVRSQVGGTGAVERLVRPRGGVCPDVAEGGVSIAKCAPRRRCWEGRRLKGHGEVGG